MVNLTRALTILDDHGAATTLQAINNAVLYTVFAGLSTCVLSWQPTPSRHTRRSAFLLLQAETKPGAKDNDGSPYSLFDVLPASPRGGPVAPVSRSCSSSGPTSSPCGDGADLHMNLHPFGPPSAPRASSVPAETRIKHGSAVDSELRVNMPCPSRWR
ncbi:hypothetical protein BCV70DRAFT_51445 [Testicularia cyperi]|uniref:Uncharacterized protein n=1 Tax=Testicularia cyperi TaxID=1882483 RepID=A0A317XV69_9BASI|nr:hypothetical protein BCV70DRAFT_51445 [Testicularia cyperi]